MQAISRYLHAMFADNGLVEVRAIGDKIFSGLFDCPHALRQAVRSANRSGEFRGIYALLNAVKLRRATNRLAPASSTTKDRDIARITRLAFDFDPVRAPGSEKLNSTSEELSDAERKARWLQGWLSKKGWPEPLVAMSGNGYHLQYRVNIAPCDELRNTLTDLYTGLRLRCETVEVSFDTSIRNAARIFRLYGTIARKSADLPDRPQRTTTCEMPLNWLDISLAQIQALAQELKPPAKIIQHKNVRPVLTVRGNGDYRTLDVVTWLRTHGFYKRHIEGGKHAVICPWVEEHSSADRDQNTDTVIWESDGGWPTFYCSHAHCDGRTIRDVMELLGDADAFCARRWRRA